MEKIINFPCPKCKVLTDGEITEKKQMGDSTIVKLVTECCKTEFSEYYTKFQLSHLLQKVG